MKSKKGFTLIELLAVIVILIIIFLVAITAVKSMLDKAEKNSVQANGEAYLKEFNNLLTVNNTDESKVKLEGVYTLSDFERIGFKMDGVKPESAYLYAFNNKTVHGCLQYENYTVYIVNGKVDHVSDFKRCKVKNGYNSDIDVYTYKYSGNEDVVNIQKDGKYLIEAWGASGGDSSDYKGGTGAYVRGFIDLQRGDKLYINVGGDGIDNCPRNGGNEVSSCAGGYNGGSIGSHIYAWGLDRTITGAGGGATSIATKSGLLKTLEKSDLIMVASGGGGATYLPSLTVGKNGLDGGGAEGNYDGEIANDYLYFASSGNQTSGGTTNFDNANGSFGQGGESETVVDRQYRPAGAGGGLYGGGFGGGAGSSYINTSVLENAAMYSNSTYTEEKLEIRTIHVNQKSDYHQAYTPSTTSGYVRISLVE